jgi:hypothetical protein
MLRVIQAAGERGQPRRRAEALCERVTHSIRSRIHFEQ